MRRGGWRDCRSLQPETGFIVDQDLAGRHLSAKVRAFVNFLPAQFGGESPIETFRCLPAGNTRALRLATGGEWRD